MVSDLYKASGYTPPTPTFPESKEIDVLPWLSRGALDYVCQATIGHSFDALDAHNPNEFTDAVRHLAYVCNSNAGSLLLTDMIE